MSTVQADIYDWGAPVTPGTIPTSVDPNGPFTALYVSGSGSLYVQPVSGPAGKTSVYLGVVNVGQYIRFPIRLVSSSSTATVVGLGSPLYRQGT